MLLGEGESPAHKRISTASLPPSTSVDFDARVRVFTELLKPDTVGKLMPASANGNTAPAQATDSQGIISCGYLARRNRFQSCHVDDPLSKVFDILGTTESRRVPVVDSEGKVLDIISQSNIMAFLHKHEEELASSLSIRLDGIGSTNVITIRRDETALDALQRMDEKHLGGIAILDTDGSMMGNLSASDLKLYLRFPLALELHQPVLAFLQRVRSQETKTQAQLVAVRNTDKLSKVIAKLAATHMHRVFVMDSRRIPVKVISLTDVIRSLCPKKRRLSEGTPQAKVDVTDTSMEGVQDISAY